MRLATKSAILIALIASLFSFTKFDHCRNHGWGGSDVYVHACYSDLPALLIDRHLNTHSWPYKSETNAVEYPPLTAMVMWGTSFFVKHDYNQYRAYFDINALLITLLFIFLVVLLKKMSPKYWYLAPLAPAVIASLFINWDIWAVLPALLSIYWFDRKRYTNSALLLGISIATKFFPIVLLIPASLILIKNKNILKKCKIYICRINNKSLIQSVNLSFQLFIFLLNFMAFLNIPEILITFVINVVTLENG